MFDWFWSRDSQAFAPVGLLNCREVTRSSRRERTRCVRDSLVLKLDVTNRSEVEAAVKAAEDHLGGIDVLVNNTGIGYFGAVELTFRTSHF